MGGERVSALDGVLIEKLELDLMIVVEGLRCLPCCILPNLVPNIT